MNAARWLRQAEHDLRRAEKLAAEDDYAYAAFFAEQSAQKSLKAFLIFCGKRFITTHSVGELAKEATALDAAFKSLVEEAARLDRHYLASRYPDALPEPAIPAESYVKSEAEDAVRVARTVFETSKKIIA